MYDEGNEVYGSIKTKQVIVAVTLYICISEVLKSNRSLVFYTDAVTLPFNRSQPCALDYMKLLQLKYLR
jgi:hypothetical protein